MNDNLNERNSAPTGANDIENKEGADRPLGGASCCASSFDLCMARYGVAHTKGFLAPKIDIKGNKRKFWMRVHLGIRKVLCDIPHEAREPQFVIPWFYRT